MKKVSVDELRVGMYVTELDRPWLETPFLFQGFTVRTAKEIEQIRRYCQHVFILEADDIATLTARKAATRRPLALEVEQDLLRLNNHPSARPSYSDVTTLEGEIAEIKNHYVEARQYADEVLRDVRLGRSVDSEGAQRVVGRLVKSVIRNPDALTCFIQLKKKHEYTAQHSLRVCILALIFGRQLGFDEERLQHLGIGALLHDVGKGKIPLEILDKPKALDARETEIMKTHVPIGVRLLEEAGGMPHEAIDLVRGHHERFDGKGYMEGRKGDDIGLFPLIAGIVDCYDAVTSERVYHAAVTPHTALKRLYEWRGQAFHPRLVEQFIQCMGIYPVGSIVKLNTGEVGVVASINRERRLKPHVVLVRRPDNTPYPSMPAVNLATRTNGDGRPCDIEQVIETDDYGINPAYFLPVPAVA